MTQAGSAHDWQRAAAAVLRKAGKLAADAPDDVAYQRLTTRTVEGIDVPPLGTPAQSVGLGPAARPGCAPFTRGSRSAVADLGWDIRSAMVDVDTRVAASAAVADLENGATSLWWTVGGPGSPVAELADALSGVYLDLAPVVLSAAGEVTDLQAAQALAALLRQNQVTPAPGTSLGADPIGRAVRERSELTGVLLADLPKILSLAADLGVRALVADGTVAHDAGAGDAAEIGYTLALAVGYLRAATAAGVEITDVLGRTEFRYAATDDQFTTIAKFRAARLTWHRVCEIMAVEPPARAQVQHAVTSRAMMTRYDPWINLLRTTVAAFAAGVGGADAVTVLPFDTLLGVPDALGRRMSRNISSLLIAESHVAKVLDPAGGSHAVEVLTRELADAAWVEFARIEQSGGILAALIDGSLPGRWVVTASQRSQRINSRRSPLTGVTEFPNLHETLPDRRPWPATATPTAPTWAAAFEAMRDLPLGPVFLATLGPVAQHTTRAGFVTNALAAGGVDVVSAGATGGVADLTDRYRAAAADRPLPVVCLTGSDPSYAELGPAAIAALREAGAAWIVLAGKPSEALSGLVDDHIAAGADLLAFLQRTRSHVSPSQLAKASS